RYISTRRWCRTPSSGRSISSRPGSFRPCCRAPGTRPWRPPSTKGSSPGSSRRWRRGRMQCCRRNLEEEDPMNVSRRELAVAGAVALTAPGLLLGGLASAQAADEAAVKENVEVLRKALLEADKAKLEQVASAQISYGHSDGRVETKDQFVNGVMTRKQRVKSLEFPELKVAVVGNAAIARHIYLAESELEGKATTTRIGALQVWQKQDA